MLRVTIPAAVSESFNDDTGEFIYTTISKEQTLQLEHSLVSLSKWESKFCKSFISTKEFTDEETIEYIKCMTITQNVDPEVYDHIPSDIADQIKDYINAPMTATVITEEKATKGRREIVTSELIYSWMIDLHIPKEFEKWHLNRLLTLIRVCMIRQQPPKKRSRSEIMRRNHALNAARRQQLNTRG
jgi:hypothetical protein